MVSWAALDKVCQQAKAKRVLLLCSALSEATLGVLGSVLGSSVHRDTDIMERVQQRDTKMMKRLEHVS